MRSFGKAKGACWGIHTLVPFWFWLSTRSSAFASSITLEKKVETGIKMLDMFPVYFPWDRTRTGTFLWDRTIAPPREELLTAQVL